MSTPPPSTEKSAKSKTINFNNALTSFLVLSLVIFSGWSFFGYQQSKKEIVKLSSLEGQQELAEQKLKTLLEQVKKHMLLPEEEPVVATISDVDALIADNQFFEGASNGDKVIVYTEAKQAIVYSPEKDLIVKVGPVVTEPGSVAGETDTNQAAVEEAEEEPAEETEEAEE